MEEQPVAERLTELETKVAFQEDAILKLRETVAEQEQQLYRLTMQVEALRKHIKEGGSAPESSKEEPPPPHY